MLRFTLHINHGMHYHRDVMMANNMDGIKRGLEKFKEEKGIAG